MKHQPARRLTSYTARPIAKPGEPVEAIARLIHKRAVNNKHDRGSRTAVFVDLDGAVFAFCADSLTADLWTRERPHWLLVVIDPSRPQYGLHWLAEELNDHRRST